MKLFIKVFIICIGTVAITACGPQSRANSRLGGSELRLELPKDFSRPISFSVDKHGEKNLFYYDTYNALRVKTYTDWGIMESEILFVKSK